MSAGKRSMFAQMDEDTWRDARRDASDLAAMQNLSEWETDFCDSLARGTGPLTSAQEDKLAELVLKYEGR